MKEKEKTNSNFIMVKTRSQNFVTCPNCWTDQRTERDFCYWCGSAFIYQDELKEEVEKEQAGPAMTRSA